MNALESRDASFEVVIDAARNPYSTWSELWTHRELLFFFAWRDIKVRYKQSVLGGVWAILQPFLAMVVFTVLFNRLVGISSGELPYAIFAYTGLIFWFFFANSISTASNSLVGYQAIVTKIYYPRILSPIASVAVGLVDFGLAALVYGGLLLYYGIAPGWLGVVLIVPMVAVSFAATAGVGIFLAALNVRYRDVRQALPFATQMVFFFTPVIYPIGFVPESFRWLLYLNPIAGVITAMRKGLLHDPAGSWSDVGISVAMAFVLLLAGYHYFRRQERVFADII